MTSLNDDIIKAILSYQERLDRYSLNKSEDKMLYVIGKLSSLPIRTAHLETTGIGRTVNALKKLGGEVGEAAKDLVVSWKDMVLEEEKAAQETSIEAEEDGDSVYSSENESKDCQKQDLIQENGNNHSHSDENESEGYSNKKEVPSKSNDDYLENKLSKQRYNSEDDDRNNDDTTSSSSSESSESEEEEEIATKIDKHNSRKRSHSSESEEEHSNKRDNYNSRKRSYSSASSSEEREKHSSKKSKHDKEKSTKDSHNYKHKSSKEDKDKKHDNRDKHMSSKHRESSERSKKNSEKQKDSSDKYGGNSEQPKESFRKHRESSEKHRESSEKYRESSEKHRESSEKHRESSEKHTNSRDSKHKQRREADEESRHKSKKESEDGKKHKTKRESEDSYSNHKSEKHRKREEKEPEDSHSYHKSDKHRKHDEKTDKDSKSSHSSKHKDKELSHSSSDKKSSKDKERRDKDKSESKKEKRDEKHAEKKSKETKEEKKSESSKPPKESTSSSKQKVSTSDSIEKKNKIKKEKVKGTTKGKIINGIDSESGASFAEALGMCGPLVSSPKKKSNSDKNRHSTPVDKYVDNGDTESSKSKSKYENGSSTSSSSKVVVPELLKDEPPEPLNICLSSLLPEITPNYKPLGISLDSGPKRMYTDDEALSRVMANKNQRTKVYSGNKTVGKVDSLFQLCVRILQDNIDALEYTGGVPYLILKPIMDRATPDQLFNLEHHNPYLIEDTDELWQLHCQKDFRTKKREEMESWRDMYMRCLDEREARLNAVKANIKQSQDKSIPVRTTKLAYIDSEFVKPPRNIARKQAKNGTVSTDRKTTPTQKIQALAKSGEAEKTSVPDPGRRAADRPSGSNSAAFKPKKAPLMAKTLSFFKNRFRR